MYKLCNTTQSLTAPPSKGLGFGDDGDDLRGEATQFEYWFDLFWRNSFHRAAVLLGSSSSSSFVSVVESVVASVSATASLTARRKGLALLLVGLGI